jgi:hypothetical protein
MILYRLRYRYTVTVIDHRSPLETINIPLPYRYHTVTDRPPLPIATHRYSPLLIVTVIDRYPPLVLTVSNRMVTGR